MIQLHIIGHRRTAEKQFPGKGDVRDEGKDSLMVWATWDIGQVEDLREITLCERYIDRSGEGVFHVAGE